MEQLGNILAGRDSQEPAEVRVIKRYIREKYQASAQITMQQQSIIIGVKGAALAGSLRPHLRELQKLSGSTKRLVIRIV